MLVSFKTGPLGQLGSFKVILKRVLLTVPQYISTLYFFVETKKSYCS